MKHAAILFLLFFALFSFGCLKDTEKMEPILDDQGYTVPTKATIKANQLVLKELPFG